jgi:pimeloyl-ACP methyl ester carboxylesterase
MATFVLIHGAWGGSWCWQRIRPVLQRLGHTVHAPTLSGVGDRSHLLDPAINLETQVADIVNLIRWENLQDIVLVGHSYGGMIATVVADRMPERIRSLVYLDAFVPRNGESLADYAPVASEILIDGWKMPPIPAAVFAVNPADCAWVDRQRTLQSVACFTQKADLRGDLSTIARVHYIFAAGWGDGSSPFKIFYERAVARGWQTTVVDCGHDVMFDQPDTLIELLNLSI